MAFVWARDWKIDADWPRHLILARHGRTEWNSRHIWQGHADIPLDETGRQEARQLAAAMAAREIDTIVASDLSRAWETAEIVAAQTGHEPISNSDLREVDVGEWEGLGVAEIRSGYADVLDAVARGEDPPRGRTGETLAQFRERIVRGLEAALRACTGDTLLIVTHGGVIKNTVGHFLGVPPRLCGRLPSGANAAITEIRLKRDGPQLRTVNDMRHLTA